MSSSGWSTIESDPAVFDEMLSRLGVRGMQLDEALSLDAAEVAASAPFGLFFLFKWNKVAADNARAAAASAGAGAGAGTAAASGAAPFFARQTIHNACGTLAMLHVALSAGAAAAGVEPGPALRDYAAFAAELPPDLRGDLLASSDVVRTTHNLFARPEPFGADDDDARPARGKKQDAFHFVAYVPDASGEGAWELDGLKAAPVALPAASGGAGAAAGGAPGWLRVALAEIARRVEEYAREEIHFCVLTAVRDKAAALAASLAAAAARAEAIYAWAESLLPGALAGSPTPAALAAALTADVPEFAAAAAAAPAAEDPSGDADALVAAYGAALADIDALRAAYRGEADTRAAQRAENERRRHNFVPFILELLKQLARKDALVPQLQGAKARVLAARERARAAGRTDRGE